MENWFENTEKGFRKLIFEVILRVKRDIIFKDKDWIFRPFKELISLGTLDNDIGNTIT
jgi:hypothetical protein